MAAASTLRTFLDAVRLWDSVPMEDEMGALLNNRRLRAAGLIVAACFGVVAAVSMYVPDSRIVAAPFALVALVGVAIYTAGRLRQLARQRREARTSA